MFFQRTKCQYHLQKFTYIYLYIYIFSTKLSSYLMSQSLQPGSCLKDKVVIHRVSPVNTSVSLVINIVGRDNGEAWRQNVCIGRKYHLEHAAVLLPLQIPRGAMRYCLFPNLWKKETSFWPYSEAVDL